MSESLPAAAPTPDPAPEASPPGRPLVTHFLYGYKQERSIRAAIEGVLAQTYQPLEVVLSDDCSPDGTYRVMQEMAAAYRGPHKVVLNRNPKNLGIAGHVERIMEIASGGFIVENAGDDVSAPDRVERLVAAWRGAGGKALVVHSAKLDVDADGDPLEMREIYAPLVGLTPLGMLQRKHALIGATMGWDRAVYDRFGPVSDVAPFHDYPIGFRALLLGGAEAVAWLDEPLVRYSKGGVSRHRPQSYGYWWFFGDRIRYMRWDLAFYRSYRRDLDRLPPPDHGPCAAAADAWIREAEFTIALAGTSHRQRLAVLPKALGLGLRHRDPAFPRMTLKYLLDRPFMRYLDWKTGRMPGADRGDTTAAAV
jgi:glycosyltransferase involved in cell wall biosynthesis